MLNLLQASADTASVDHLEAYRSYIDFETKLNEPTRMQSLFERALADFPLQTDLWLQYTDYLVIPLSMFCNKLGCVGNDIESKGSV